MKRIRKTIKIGARKKERQYCKDIDAKLLKRKITSFTDIDALENTWDNLPSDLSQEEKYMFLDIAERMIRLENKLQDHYGNTLHNKN